MDSASKGIMITMLVIVVGVFAMGMFFVQTQTTIQALAKDTNTLLNNDVYFAQYIQSNSTANEFLAGCKIMQDNNTTVDLTCFKQTAGGK